MVEHKFTPGPWAHINPDGFTVRHPQVYSDTGPVCNATWLGDGRIDELRANARLIAAAPDMFHALNLALEYWQDRQQRYRNRSPVWVQEARAAIAKATGAADG